MTPGVTHPHPPPTAAQIEAIARATLAALPPPFGQHLHDVVLRIEDLADAETLAALQIDHPLDLTGLYEGIPIGEKSAAIGSGAMPVIHEVGHHFGLDDDAIHALEDAAS